VRLQDDKFFTHPFNCKASEWIACLFHNAFVAATETGEPVLVCDLSLTLDIRSSPTQYNFSLIQNLQPGFADFLRRTRAPFANEPLVLLLPAGALSRRPGPRKRSVGVAASIGVEVLLRLDSAAILLRFACDRFCMDSTRASSEEHCRRNEAVA